MRIVVGSTSPHKIGAVRVACSGLDLSATIQGFAVQSRRTRTAAQEREIIRGASNRALAVIELEPVADLYVGVESGIVDAIRYFVDMAAIVVRSKQCVIGFSTSPGIVVDNAFVHAARAGGRRDVTIGTVMNEKVDADPSDGTSWLTKGRMSRREQMACGVIAALAQALAK